MECPKCSAQITGKKCSYCGYEVPEEKKPDYINEITDSLGKIAGHILSEYADDLTGDHTERKEDYCNTSKSENNADGNYDEIKTPFGKCRVKRDNTGQTDSNYFSTNNSYGSNTNRTSTNNINTIGRIQRKIVFIVFVVVAVLIGIPFLLIMGSRVYQACLDGMEDYKEYSDFNSSGTGQSDKLNLSGEYLLSILDINTKAVEVWVGRDIEKFTVSGQAEEYVDSMKENLENVCCYLEAKDGIISVLYKKSPVIYVIDDLGDNHYLVTDGPDDFFEIVSDTQLNYGKCYDTYYEWKEDTMKMFFAEEYDPLVPYNLDNIVNSKFEKTIVERAGNRECTAYYVNIDGSDYIVSKETYVKLEEGTEADEIRLDNEMGVVLPN